MTVWVARLIRLLAQLIIVLCAQLCFDEKETLHNLHFKLAYCSQVWHLVVIRDISKIITVQRYIIHPWQNFVSAQLHILLTLDLLPLMYFLELADIMFLISSLKNPVNQFNILDYVQLQDSHTHSFNKLMLKHVRSTNLQRHSSCKRVCQGYGTKYHPSTYHNSSYHHKSNKTSSLKYNTAKNFCKLDKVERFANKTFPAC